MSNHRKRNYPHVDNVIYANFGKKRNQEPPSENRRDFQPPDNPRQPPGLGVSQFLRSAVVSHTDSGRVYRGRDYAFHGHVVNLEISHGRVDAQVVGSQPQPFSTTMLVPYRTSEELRQVAHKIAADCQGLRDLNKIVLGPEMRSILLAEQPDDLRFICDCPDPQPVCKHVVALVEVLIRRLEADPSEILRLRGMDRAFLHMMVSEESEHRSTEASADSGERFWGNGEMPDLPEPKTRPAIHDSDMDLLHQAMRMVSYTTIDQLRAVSDIEDLYHYLTEKPDLPAD
ncbi:hypothetical protein GSS88_04455 [Corynebacterium sp. 3HC-13]|uniref:SWIM zinc finger family protein n=1 Tax=Corynebacterium poyangense TaxID=2684405 RepID=UPI001CCCB1FC|nr:hypothetical protein [Corynebacterium poyangense]MBZ8177051.1 hypothetical protein [Corynebacterium poyangense]